jgi:hypothetical protein
MIERPSDPRLLRIFDLRPDEAIVVRCKCGWITVYGDGVLQRTRRLPSDTLIYDLQFRLRCSYCNERRSFKISVQDQSHLGDKSKQPAPAIVIVEGE